MNSVVKQKYKKPQLIPSPGIALIEPMEEKKQNGGISMVKESYRIIPGKIIAMGINLESIYGGKLNGVDYGEAGDTIYFYHIYQEGGYDTTYLNDKKYFLIKWEDFRLNLGKE